jgi:hypothetical protein
VQNTPKTSPRFVLALPVVLSLALSAPVISQEAPLGPGLKLYDSFSGLFLDPAKWSAQWQCGSTVLECVRELQGGKLHLRARGYGDDTVDGGTQFGVSEVYLRKATVTSYGAWVTVGRTAAGGCPTGAGGDGLAQAAVWANFFSDGGGDTSYNDVTAFLELDHASSDAPEVLRVGGFLSSRYQTWPGSVSLGQVRVGERVFLNLTWDQPNHRFATSLFRPDSNAFVRQYLPYGIADDIPPASRLRSLSVRVQPVNCLGQRTSSEMDVWYDGVVAN